MIENLFMPKKLFNCKLFYLQKNEFTIPSSNVIYENNWNNLIISKDIQILLTLKQLYFH
jgi:hypothetical protein